MLTAGLADRIGIRWKVSHGWIIVFALGTIAIVAQGTTFNLSGIVLVPLQHEFGWSRGQVSIAYSLSYLVWGLAGIPIGGFIDRRGARLIMAAGALLTAGSLALLTQASQLWQLYLLWGLGLGLGVALTSQQASLTVIANWFYWKRGLAFGTYTALAGLTLPIYVPVVAWIVVHAGWRAALLAVAASFLFLVLPLALLIVRRRSEDPGLPQDSRPTDDPLMAAPSDATGLTLKQALARPAFWTLTVSAAGPQIAYAGISAHTLPFLIGRHFDPVLAATFVGLAGLVSIPGRLIFNAAGDRLGSRTLLAAATGLQGLGILVLIQATSIAWLIAYVVVYGSAFGAASGLRAAVMADHWGRRSFGAITAATGLVSVGAAASGPATMGWLYDRFGNYELAFALAAACFGIGVLAVVVTPHAPAELALHPGG